MAANRWSNWAGNQQTSPARVVTPGTTADVAAAVDAAGRAGLPVKAVGSGHSFSGIASTSGCLLRPDALTQVLRADATTGLVTVQAGMPLHRLNALLAGYGLALPNLGDIDRQTVAGAIATGTHGTGARFGGLATQVHGLELVLADGSLLQCSAEENPEVFSAVQIGLGALGVVTAVTLACVPAFHLHAVEEPMPLRRVLGELDGLVEANEHFEFYWFPHTKVALTKRNNRVPASAGRPLRPVRRWVDDELLANTAFGLVQRACAALPQVTPAANNLSARALATREYVDASHRVFTSPRRVRFVEMEYAVPRHTVADVLREIDQWTAARREPLPFPVEVRFAAADDIWLSTAYQRESAYVAVHQYPGLQHEHYFGTVERIVAGVGGRPHWGKLHGLHADTLRDRYPRFDDFVAVRDRLDPEARFDNPYLRAVLGAPNPHDGPSQAS